MKYGELIVKVLVSEKKDSGDDSSIFFFQAEDGIRDSDM